MPHIHTQPGEHDHTASAYIFRLDHKEPKVVLHLHKKLKKFIQFGGHIETNETPWAAITHELLEESGYEMSQLEILQPKDRIINFTNAKIHPIPIYHNTHKFNDEHFHTDVAYAFITKEEPKHKIADNESDNFLLLSREELLALPDNQTLPSVREAAIFVFDTGLSQWEVVDPSHFN